MNIYCNNGCISSLSQLQEKNRRAFWEWNQADLPTGHHSGTSTRVLSLFSLLINFPLITEAMSDTRKKKPFFLPAWSQGVSLSHPQALTRGEVTWDSSPGPFQQLLCPPAGTEITMRGFPQKSQSRAAFPWNNRSQQINSRKVHVEFGKTHNQGIRIHPLPWKTELKLRSPK